MTVAAPLARETASRLDDFDAEVRRRELERLSGTAWPAPTNDVNLHCHTFFSYNAYGYSPTRVAVVARLLGLEMAGTVDFDCVRRCAITRRMPSWGTTSKLPCS